MHSTCKEVAITKKPEAFLLSWRVKIPEQMKRFLEIKIFNKNHIISRCRFLTETDFFPSKDMKQKHKIQSTGPEHIKKRREKTNSS
jgi:hypothetical protein